MSDQKAKGCIVAAVVWCLVMVVLAVAYKFLVGPYLSKKLTGATSSDSQYSDEVVVAADSFSGYAILRSDAVKADLRKKKLKLTVTDDKADYAARLKALKEGRAHMAVFTVDSLLTAGVKAGDFPASIVMVIDETQGSDAIVAVQGAVGNMQDLNSPDARFVLTPNSPSEFLARVVIANFNLPRLPAKWWIEADGAAAVHKLLRADAGRERRAYVLWEPYVTKALEKKGVQVLLDSSRLKGYIVDVLVAERSFLNDHPDRVRAVIEAYLRAAYTYSQQSDGLVNLVREDAKSLGAESLDESQARQVTKGIFWKNTLENYAHLGVVTGAERGGVQHIEDIIGNIVDVLVKTRAIPSDPLKGDYHTLFYNKVLASIRSGNFHPGRGMELTAVAVGAGDLEKVRTNQELAQLNDSQWKGLRRVGELKIDPVEFQRGVATINPQSERDLQELAHRLQSFPRYYMRVVGHARAEGDAEANRALASGRAESVAQALIGMGVNKARIRAEAAPPAGAGSEYQAVSFVVGQVPY